MYRIKKDILHEFVLEDANLFLLRFFAENDGLTVTALDSKFKPERPTCRQTALEALI